MDEEQMRRWVAETLERLGTSGFRAGFTLSAKDRAYALEHGEATVRRHARELLERRVGPAHPAHDGKQTPFRGHPVFTAQHATATCCRGCIAKWHHIPQGRPLTDEELGRLSELTVRWIRRDIARHDPTHGLDQHFLCKPEKIARLVDAAGIREGDRVAELGAGVGTVAAEVPEGASLTLVELDPALCARLRERFAKREGVRVVQGDALAYLAGAKAGDETPDVIISNLPAELTSRMLDALADMRFRTAVVAVRAGQDLAPWEGRLEVEPVETLEPGDFSPRQPFASEVVRVRG